MYSSLAEDRRPIQTTTAGYLTTTTIRSRAMTTSIVAGTTRQRTTLLNGYTYIQGGTGGGIARRFAYPDGTFHLLDGANTQDLSVLLPAQFYCTGWSGIRIRRKWIMYFVDTTGAGALTKSTKKLTGPIGNASSTAMFRPGRIILFGSKSSGASVIDITGATPVVTTTQSLSSIRRWVNATILADGKVLATGGTKPRMSWAVPTTARDLGSQYGSMDSRRQRQHCATLPLDGAAAARCFRVGWRRRKPGPVFNDNVEIYYPPYLYDANGGWAVRPGINSAPTYLDINETFAVHLASASQVIQRVVLVKTGPSLTASIWISAFVELTFQQHGRSVDGSGANSRSRRAARVLPAFRHQSRPGHLRWAASRGSASPRHRIQASRRTSTILATRRGRSGTRSALQLVRDRSRRRHAEFWRNRPAAGLAIDGVTGLISGTPTSIGTFNVVGNGERWDQQRQCRIPVDHQSGRIAPSR